MNPVAEVLSTVFGVVLVGAIAFEIRQRRKSLRELYNVLDVQDKSIVADLDHMVAAGKLQPHIAH